MKSMADLTKLAETYIDAHGGNLSVPKGKQGRSSAKPTVKDKAANDGDESKEKDVKYCKYCRKTGHDVTECRRVPGPDGKKRCFLCFSTDHLAYTCPKTGSCVVEW